MSLTHTQSEALKRLIDARSVELREKIRETLPRPADETTLERTGLAQDEVDEATTSAEEYFNHTLHEHYLEEMRQIEAARERVHNGLIDSCVDCNDDIGYPRLRAQPFAVRCLDCQKRYEQRLSVLRR